MNISCEVIMDLLPLYHDGVCNESSKKLVEEHLKSCDACKTVLAKMKDDTVDIHLKHERDDIIGHHTRAVKRKSLIVGISIAAVMTVPILVTMIVNLAVGRTLDWFFIVLTSLMTLASITVVPLVFEKNRGLWTLGGFTGSLTLLLATCTIYTGGDWFFVAIIPVLFGLCILFGPYVLGRLPLPGFALHNKGLIAMAANSILLFAVIFASGLYTGVEVLSAWQSGLLTALVALMFPWGLFAIIRYIKSNSLIKAGLSTIFGGLFLSFGLGVIDWILEGTIPYRFSGANLLVWNNATINPNIFLLMLLTGCIVGGALLTAGFIQKKKS